VQWDLAYVRSGGVAQSVSLPPTPCADAPEDCFSRRWDETENAIRRLWKNPEQKKFMPWSLIQKSNPRLIIFFGGARRDPGALLRKFPSCGLCQAEPRTNEKTKNGSGGAFIEG